jgi:hypothetical protein
VSDDAVIFLGAGELLAVAYDITLPVGRINNKTVVEFYTSFGFRPKALDSFLTNEDKYGSPYEIGLEVKELKDVKAELEVIDMAYYPNLKRIGIEIENIGTEKVYANIRINSLVVNGLEEDLFKEDSLEPGQRKMIYLPVELDKIDMEENEFFHLTIAYGTDQDNLIKRIVLDLPFQVKQGNLITGFVTGLAAGSAGSIITLIVLIVIIIGVIVFATRKKGKDKS